MLSITISCSKDLMPISDKNLKVTLWGDPQCKGLIRAVLNDDVSNSQSCIEYSYNESLRLLSIKHLNAGFNCCPDTFSCTALIREDTIIIREFEKHMGCKCNCLYDVEMDVEGVLPGKYQLQIIEPYILNQDILCFELDLKNQKKGTWCVNRWIYPWGN